MVNIDPDFVRPAQEIFPRRGSARSEKDWALIRRTILDALKPFPGAREAVARALTEMKEESGDRR